MHGHGGGRGHHGGSGHAVGGILGALSGASGGAIFCFVLAWSERQFICRWTCLFWVLMIGYRLLTRKVKTKQPPTAVQEVVKKSSKVMHTAEQQEAFRRMLR
jgi:hypothetical protein